MIQYTKNIDRFLDVFDCIVRNDGKNIADIVKAEDTPYLRRHIGDFIDQGLAKKYKHGYREVHLTLKGHLVMELLKQAKEAMDSDEGSNEYYILTNPDKEGYK